MRKILSAVMAAVAAFVCGGAFGATPVPLAVWEGNFTGANEEGGIGGTYKLCANGNTIAEDGSSVAISADATGGITIGNFPENTSAFTVVLKYSGLNLTTEQTQTFLTAQNNIANIGNNRLGVYVQADEAKKIHGLSSNENGYWGYGNAGSAPAAEGVMVITHSSAGGTYVYQKGDTVTSLYGADSLKYGSNNYDSISIGSMVDSEAFGRATGLTIEKVAVHASVLSSEQIANYKWPSEELIYTCTVAENGTAEWSPSEPDTFEGGDRVVFMGAGSFDLTKDVPCDMIIGSGVTVVAQENITGNIVIDAGAVLTVTKSGLQKTRVTNNGTINILGGTVDNPVIIEDNGAGNTGFGAITIASNSVLKNYATNGNKVYTVTGAGDHTSTLILGSGVNWGMTPGTAIRNVKMLVREKEFWFERVSALDATVDLDLGTYTHLGDGENFTFEIGSLSGGGNMISGENKTLTINMDREDSTYSGDGGGVPFIVKGEKTLTLTSAYTGALTISEGARVKYDPGAETTITPNITTDSTGTLIVASGTVDLGSSRLKLDVAEGARVNLTTTLDELKAGSLQVGVVGDNVETLVDRITVVDVLGSEVAIEERSFADGVLTLTFAALPAITKETETKSISELNLAEDALGVLVIKGTATAEEAFDVTFDAALPANVTVAINGYVNLKVGEGQVLPTDRMTFVSGATITIDSSCTLAVPAGVTVNATGDISVTLTNNGTFNVVSGTCTVTAANSQSVKGTLNIAKGATFVNRTTDAVAYDTDTGTIVHVKGTLDMGSTRWTVGRNSAIHLYGGCTVSGEGTIKNGVNEGIFDLYRTGKVLDVHKGDGDDATPVTLSRIRARSGNSGNSQSDITIDTGMTLLITDGITVGTESNGVAKFGDGLLTIRKTLTAASFFVRSGSIRLEAEADAETLVASAISGGTVVVGGAGTVKTTGTLASAVNIDEGATLELAKADHNYTFGIGTADNQRKLSGTLIIDSGVTYTAQHGDVLNYVSGAAGGKGTVVVKGTLAMGDKRWSYNRDNKIIVYGGATVAGTGNAEGAVDYFNDGGVIEAQGAGTVDWQAKTRARGNITFFVAEDLTVNHSGGILKETNYPRKIITKTGAGVLNLIGTPIEHSFKLADGTIKSVTALTVTTDAEGQAVRTETTTEGENTVYTYTLESVAIWPENWTADPSDEITARFAVWRANHAEVELTEADEKAFLLNIAPTGEEPVLAVTAIGFDADGKVVLTTGDVDLSQVNGVAYLYTGDDVRNLATARALTAEELDANTVKVALDPTASAGFYKLGVGYAAPQGASAE